MTVLVAIARRAGIWEAMRAYDAGMATPPIVQTARPPVNLGHDQTSRC